MLHSEKHPHDGGTSVGPGQYPRHTDARKGRPWVAQKHHKTQTLTRRNKFVEHLHFLSFSHFSHFSLFFLFLNGEA